MCTSEDSNLDGWAQMWFPIATYFRVVIATTYCNEDTRGQSKSGFQLQHFFGVATVIWLQREHCRVKQKCSSFATFLLSCNCHMLIATRTRSRGWFGATTQNWKKMCRSEDSNLDGWANNWEHLPPRQHLFWPLLCYFIFLVLSTYLYHVFNPERAKKRAWTCNLTRQEGDYNY
jgi:hypothetical protein